MSMNKTQKKLLLAEWLKHKKAEDAAKKKRYDVEEKLVKEYADFSGTSKKVTEDDLGFSITVTKSITVKLDQDKYAAVRNNIPENLLPEKIKYELDKKGFEFLKENEKEIYLMVSSCVTETPGKPTIKVEKI